MEIPRDRQDRTESEFDGKQRSHTARALEAFDVKMASTTTVKTFVEKREYMSRVLALDSRRDKHSSRVSIDKLLVNPSENVRMPSATRISLQMVGKAHPRSKPMVVEGGLW